MGTGGDFNYYTLGKPLFLETDIFNEEMESEGVFTSFFRVGDSKIELLAATNNNSPIAKFIEKRGEGIHHIAFDVIDIRAEIDRAGTQGICADQQSSEKGG